MRLILLTLTVAAVFACNTQKKSNVQPSSMVEETLNDADVVSEGPKPIAPDIVFGSFCGHCEGNCVSLYRIGPNVYDARADKSNNLIRKGLKSVDFSIGLSQGECDVANEINGIIPMELFDMKSQDFGCPDCADQCGYLVQIIQYNGETQTFRIDTQVSALPDFLQEFPGQIEEILKRLKTSDN